MTQTQHVSHKEGNQKIAWYPVSLFAFIDRSRYFYDTRKGILYEGSSVSSRATTALYALSQWNSYIATKEQLHHDIFLGLSRLLVASEDALQSALSAEVLGCELSVFVRAYQLTGLNVFFRAATRVASYFERDILDNGVVAPIGTEGVFFEEIVRYPAHHTLRRHLFALFGLFDYVMLTHDVSLTQVLQQALATLRTLLTEFDTGFWTYTDLLTRTLSSPTQLSQQIQLLQGLADITSDAGYLLVAKRWQRYEQDPRCKLRYHVRRAAVASTHKVLGKARSVLFPLKVPDESTLPLRVCVTVNAFPVLGGVRTVLLSMEEVMKGWWQTEYLTRYVGPNADEFTIHRFGSAAMHPWHAHTVWFYVLDGCRGLLALFRRGAGYQLVFPQDGVYTAAFTSIIAKLADTRVVCIDHAYLTMLNNPTYKAERIAELQDKPWYKRAVGRFLFSLYWPSMYLLAWIAARCVDAYFIPGIAGDGVELSCARLGIHASRITRFASMINLEQHPILQQESKRLLRQQLGIPEHAIVIAITCRLALEKGLDVAIAGIAQALAMLEPTMKERVRVIIAGDGPIRTLVERDIALQQVQQVCSLRGNVPHEEVLQLLSISDIFLNTSVRGTCFPMSILEAMASACAIIASNQPISNEQLLAEGRGIAIPAGDVLQNGQALAQLIVDEQLRQTMGQAARNYIATRHSPEQFRRALQCVTYWEPGTPFSNETVR